MTALRPDEILAESFRIIEVEVGDHSFSPLEWPIVRRIIHASGDLEMVRLVHFTRGAAAAGVSAFRARTPIVTDGRMAAAGIQTPLRGDIDLHCFLDNPEIRTEAEALGLTRSACAIERAVQSYPEAVYVVGNAPTALSALCAAVRRGAAQPRLVVAMPVGFVGVVQSKDEALTLPVPVITVLGRRGGSAVAAAAVNALLLLAAERTPA